MSEAPSAEVDEDTEIEIEFISELGHVFVVREGDAWRCAVKLAGHGAEGEGSLGSDGERTAAYQCFEYLSHLLKHDNLFVDLIVEKGRAPRAPANQPRRAGDRQASDADKKRG